MTLISSTIPTLIGGVSQQPFNIRLPSQCEAMENCFPSVVEFLRRRPATRNIAHIIPRKVADTSVHIIDRDMAEQYVVVCAENDLFVFDIHGNRKTVNYPQGKAYLTTQNPSTDFGYLTINDYTFILNKTITATGSDVLTPIRQPEALVFIKQASYATDYHITLDGEAFLHTTFKDDNRDGNGLEYRENNGFDMHGTVSLDAARYKLSSATIAQDLASKINAAGPYYAMVVKSSIWIRTLDNSDFTAKVSDSRSNTHITITTDKVQRFTDLPTVAPSGYVTEITGDPSSGFDNYYVRFETNDNSDFDSGVWIETVKPGITDRIEASTMPHALVREADGTFSFKELDWTPRKCGDLDSAPNPTFIGRKISSVFFYRNRLGLLAGENCILSEAGKFFNFFCSTVTTTVDSDVIDVAASHDKETVLKHAAASSVGLLLFSDTAQFILEHEDVLSFKTTAVKPLTAFEYSSHAAPISVGKTVFFATGRGAWAGVREYYVEEDTSLTDAADITSHIPHYISGTINKLVCSTDEDCLLALTDKERRSMYLYKYFWNGKDKLQSSWSKWTFAGEVLSAAFLNSSLMMVMQYDDGVYLEVMHIEPGYVDGGLTYEYSMDRKISEADIDAISYDSANDSTTLTFPYQLPCKPLVVSSPPTDGEPSAFPDGVSFEVITWGGNKATVSGDIRACPFLAGIPYTSRFLFSPQILREDSGGSRAAVVEGRLQLRNMTLTYGKTGYFVVEVTPEYRQTDQRIFSGRILGHGANILGQPAVASGTFRFPILSKADAVTVQLLSDSFLPFQITSAGWEGYFNIRSKRV